MLLACVLAPTFAFAADSGAGEGCEDSALRNASVSSAANYLKVSISYAPTAKGHVAVLTALPDSNIEGLSYGLNWEYSTDDGKTWGVYNDESVQSISIMTDDKSIGNLFRVVLEASDKDPKTGENRKAVSDPVKIAAVSMPIVEIDFKPPFAGDAAIFVARISETKSDPIDEKNATYLWEFSCDDGNTWSSFVPSRTGRSLRIPTTTIDEDASSLGSEAKLMLVRVIVSVPNHGTLVSQPVPFMVRIGCLDNPMKVTAKDVTVKAKKLRKKARTFKAITVKKAKGKVTYKLKKALRGKKNVAKRFTVNKSNGKITIKKGTKKGIYRLKVKVRAAGKGAYEPKSKTVTVKVFVK